MINHHTYIWTETLPGHFRPCPDEACGSQLRGAIAGCKCGCKMKDQFQTEQGSCCEVQLRGAIIAGATFLSRRIAVVLLRPRDTDMHLITLCRITT